MTHENEEITRLIKQLNEFYVFTLQSVRHILNSTSVDKVTHCIKNNTLEKSNSEFFMDMLYSKQTLYHNGSNLQHELKLDYISDNESEIIDHIRKNGYINLGIL